MSNRKTPWELWPFVALWDLLALVLGLTGRLVALILGVAVLALGIVITLTIIGAPVGIPLAIVGLLLIVRSIF